MSQAMQPTPWTEAQFFAWLERQDGRHELVNGQPRAMTGATRRHDRITLNLLVALARQLRGSPCWPGTGDTAIRIPDRTIRYPDAAVDCGQFHEDARVAGNPALVAEVLSPSTMDFDQTEKLEEYRSVPSLRYILVLDQDQPRARLHMRDAEGHWGSAPHAGLAAEIPLPLLGISLALAELYEGLTFRPLPRLVLPEEGA